MELDNAFWYLSFSKKIGNVLLLKDILLRRYAKRLSTVKVPKRNFLKE